MTHITKEELAKRLDGTDFELCDDIISSEA